MGFSFDTGHTICGIVCRLDEFDFTEGCKPGMTDSKVPELSGTTGSWFECLLEQVWRRQIDNLTVSDWLVDFVFIFIFVFGSRGRLRPFSLSSSGGREMLKKLESYTGVDD